MKRERRARFFQHHRAEPSPGWSGTGAFALIEILLSMTLLAITGTV